MEKSVQNIGLHYRDTTVAETLTQLDRPVTLVGWVATIRDHGQLLFVELRDHTGIVQLVFNHPENYNNLVMESVIQVNGLVIRRAADQINPNTLTGAVEVLVNKMDIISGCLPLPFAIKDATKINDELSLKYRYLSMRNSVIKHNLHLRSELNWYIRSLMRDLGFMEVNTPILTADSPEGARSFVVPSRLHQGKFYVLPQAPQIFKQLLMVGGVNRYYQLAPCFRDEDARADRCYGEFYQLDLEMAFVVQDDVFILLFYLLENILAKFNPTKKIFKHHIGYDESMETFGTDKPNFNNPLRIKDFTDIFSRSSMDLFVKNIQKGSVVKGFVTKNHTSPDKVLKHAESIGFKIAYISNIDGVIKGPIAKFLPPDLCNIGETMFFICDKPTPALKKTHLIMNYVAQEDQLFTQDHHLVIVKDFPFFEQDDQGKWDFTHNPFSMPQTQDFSDPSKVKAYQYDLVLNGYELASGSIRNHSSDLLIKAFGICGYSEEEVSIKFSSLVNAFKYGVPPHGGAAIGIERLLMILTNSENVRAICAFPMNTHGTCHLTNAPSVINPKNLKELGIKTLG